MIAQSVADILRDHVKLSVEGIDRMVLPPTPWPVADLHALGGTLAAMIRAAASETAAAVTIPISYAGRQGDAHQNPACSTSILAMMAAALVRSRAATAGSI
jgi:hypothetical protein